MDTSKAVTHVSLCAGYGGIDLGLKRAIPNLRTVAFSEIEGFACANLVAKMEAGLLDAAPIWTNLKTFPWAEFRGRVDILSGGYPCQPFSAAGKRLGTDDPRHLWPFIADGIRVMQPRVCFFENVEGHISLGLRAVIKELESLGYKTTWGIFSAREVGAPHQRKRVFIMAERSGERSASRFSKQIEGQEGVAGESYHSSYQVVADTDTRGQSLGINSRSSATQDCGGQNYTLKTSGVWPSSPGEPQHEWEPPRVVTGRQTLDDSKERSMRDDSDNQRKTTGEGHPTDHSGLCSEPPRVVANSLRSGGKESSVQPADILTESGRGDTQGVGDTESQRSSTQRAKHEGLGGELCAASASGESIVGNASRELLNGSGSGAGEDRCAKPANAGQWQAEPPLGGNLDGPAGGLDYAELCISGDNRTDELRLLGNGVVPATATRAFLTLLKELNE